MINGMLLRLSASPICNLRCQYCPPTMENRAPEKCNRLSTMQVVEFLRYASGFGISGISLTGGEPWLRTDLVDLVTEIKRVKAITRLEITTNGTANDLEDIPLLVEAGITHAKVSLDTLNPSRYKTITKKPFHSKVLDSLAVYKSAGVPTTINCVLAKSILPEIPVLIKFALEHGYNLSFLDLVYDAAIHDFWVSEFCQTAAVEERIHRLTGAEGRSFDRFGCRTIEYAVDGIVIHLKDSTVTMRTERCRKCPQYCQEGLFALRLSPDGWLTTCPNNSPENGIYVVNNKESLSAFLLATASEFSDAVCTHSFGQLAKLL